MRPNEQLTLGGLPPLPADRPRGRPTKERAKEHAQAVRKAVLANLPSREQAKQRAERGQERAAAHAERVHGGWQDRACDLTLEYGRLAGSAGFLIEEARAYARGQGIEPPPDARSWGKVATRLRVEKRIEAIGARRAVTSNGSFKVAWRVL